MLKSRQTVKIEFLTYFFFFCSSLHCKAFWGAFYMLLRFYVNVSSSTKIIISVSNSVNDTDCEVRPLVDKWSSAQKVRVIVWTLVIEVIFLLNNEHITWGTLLITIEENNLLCPEEVDTVTLETPYILFFWDVFYSHEMILMGIKIDFELQV